MFLFAVVRRVQRNLPWVRDGATCGTTFLFAVARRVQRNWVKDGATCGTTGFLFAVARRVQRNRLCRKEQCRVVRRRFYSLSLDAYSGTLRRSPLDPCATFLFAVARRVQRNAQLGLALLQADLFLFAVARRVQRNKKGKTNITPKDGFLFAVARRVQRNVFLIAAGRAVTCFYSLSLDAYSGTAAHSWPRAASRVSIRCR